MIPGTTNEKVVPAEGDDVLNPLLTVIKLLEVVIVTLGVEVNPTKEVAYD